MYLVSKLVCMIHCRKFHFFLCTEQQHVEMNLKINLGGLSTLLSFSDDVQLPQHKLADELVDIDFDVRHLGLYWQGIVIDVQVNTCV